MAPPTAIAPMIHVVRKSDWRGSPHQLKGILFHEGRAKRLTFQPLMENSTVPRVNTGMIIKMIKHKIESGFLCTSLLGVNDS